MNFKALPVFLALLAGCNGIVVKGGGSGDAGSAGSAGSSGSAGAAGSGPGGDAGAPGAQPSIALTRAQMDAAWDEYWATHGGDPGGGTGGGPDNLDPNDLFLRIAAQGVSCGAPVVELQCGGYWDVTLVVPPSLQQPGVYDLEDPLLVAYSSMSETGAINPGNPGDCSWGGGSLGSGTLEIVSLDANEVHYRLAMGGDIWSSDPSGEYVAPRCTNWQ